MRAKKQVWILTFILAVVPSKAFGQAASPVPSDDEIRKILVQRIDVAKQSVGIVVGVIEPQGRRIISYGALAKDDKRPLNGDTLFEIGSISKVFTSLLMSDMVQRGEVALTDPIAKYPTIPTRTTRLNSCISFSLDTRYLVTSGRSMNIPILAEACSGTCCRFAQVRTTKP
jgi:CubicO group peptidase (beta-lactamase class C family)